MLVILILAILALAIVAVGQLVVGRRDVSLYGPIVSFNRRLQNFESLRSSPASLRLQIAAIWNGGSAIGRPPPTVRVIGPDGKPLEPTSSPPINAPGTYAPGPAATGGPRGRAGERGSEREASTSQSAASRGFFVGGRAPGAKSDEGSPGSILDSARGRRKLVFEALLALFAFTFTLGLLPGMRPVLLLSLLFGALLAAYVAVLRKLKLQQDALRKGGPHPRP